MGCTGGICKQPESLSSISRGKRWAFFIIVVLETMVWSGTIFGWGSLVHVLKLQGVYLNLCPEDVQDHDPALHNTSAAPNATYTATLQHEHPRKIKNITVCPAQDDRMALLYTVAVVSYAIPGFLIGWCLHYFGLAFTRVCGGLMVSCGFILLSYTTKATPDNLWGATLLLSVGGNVMRMAALQFGNLFPENRNTAMAVISGIFTPSAAVMTIIQIIYEMGMNWHHICWFFAAASCLILVATLFLPRHHIPFTTDTIITEDSDDFEVERTVKDINKHHIDTTNTTTLRSSVFSVSFLLHTYWIFINMIGITIFSEHFNTWINKIAKTQEEAGHYSRWFGIVGVMCVVVTPLPALTLDLTKRKLTKGKEGIKAKVASLRAFILPKVVLSCSVITQISMLFFTSPWAVYVGLLCLTLNRPSVMSVGVPFIRERYPADHFNRLIGIMGTLTSLFTTIQYPHFTWAQQAYNLTFGVTVASMILGLADPLHLFSTSYLLKVLRAQPLDV